MSNFLWNDSENNHKYIEYKSVSFLVCFPDACCNYVYLDVAYVSYICCMCFIRVLRMVAMVFKCVLSVFF
jgi:hypothetical protein